MTAIHNTAAVLSPSLSSARPAPMTRLPPLGQTVSSARPGRAPAAAAKKNPSTTSFTAAPPSSASSAAAAAPYLTLLEIPDQLLCAPDNALWVYGQYTLSYFTSEATAQAKLEKKVVAMLREAERQYELSCAYFASLSEAERRAEVLRSAHVNTVFSASAAAVGGATTATASTHTGRTPAPVAAAPHAGPASEDGTAGDDGLYAALRAAWPPQAFAAPSDDVGEAAAREDGSAAWDDTQEEDEEDALEQEEEEESLRSAERRIDLPSSSRLRVNLVLDIVASRKTLGPAPLRSRAYRIADGVYRCLLHTPSNTTAVLAEASLRSSTGPPQQKELLLTPPSTPPPPPPLTMFLPAPGSAARYRPQTSSAAHPPPPQSNPAAAAAAAHTAVVGAPPPPAAAMRGKEARSGSGDATHRLLAHFAPCVRALIIGISDTDITLVGRDIVCPYRHMPSLPAAQLRLRRAVEAAAEALRRSPKGTTTAAAATDGSFAGTAAAAAAAGAGGAVGIRPVSTMTGGGAAAAAAPAATASSRSPLSACARVVARQLQTRPHVEGLLPGPYTRVAPRLLPQIDQSRLILCTPPVEWQRPT